MTNETETKTENEVNTMLSSLAPIVAWMKENGVVRLENNGLALNLDVSEYTAKLREQLAEHKATLYSHGLLRSPKSRYAIPDMPQEMIDPNGVE